MPTETAKIHTYRVTLEGYGGEYACIPLTPEQARYWKDQGDDALAAHIALRGKTDKQAPSECQVPDFRKQGDNYLVGFDTENCSELLVEDEEGNTCLQLNKESSELSEMTDFTKAIGPFDGPPTKPFVMFRTALKGTDVYDLTTSAPFDAALLKLCAAEVARLGDVIFSIAYEGGKIDVIDRLDRSNDDHTARLIDAKPE